MKHNLQFSLKFQQQMSISLKFLFLFLCYSFFLQLQAIAQQKTGRRTELNEPLKVETIPVKGNFQKKPLIKVASKNIDNKKKGTTLPRGFIAEKIILANQALTLQNNAAPTKTYYTIYRPTTQNTKGNKTLSDCDEITLTRQSQIDSFPVYYPDCSSVKKLTIDGRGAEPAITNLNALAQITEIREDLFIYRTAVTSLGALNNITTINNYLWLDSNYALISTDLTNLTKMSGLIFSGSPNLENMDGLFSSLSHTDMWSVIFGQLGLNDFSAFSPIQSVYNFSIADCPNITSLDGFENLNSAPYGMQLFGNENLTDISHLDQITQTANLSIYICNKLSSLQGLHNITKIDGVVKLVVNQSITNLTDFHPNLAVLNEYEEDEKVEITFNSNLSVCDAPFLCNYLGTGGEAEIFSNAAGCNSPTEIAAKCGVSLGCDPDDYVIWTGELSSDWDDGGNWSTGWPPEKCTTVEIPSGTPHDPELTHDVTIGGLIMEGSTLYFQDYSFQDPYILSINGPLDLRNAFIYGAGKILNNKAQSPVVDNCNIDADFECKDYTGEAKFWFNSFDGKVTLSDHPDRDEGSSTFFNSFYDDFTLINNSEYGQMYLSNASPLADQVYGKLTVINNANADISVGLGGGNPLLVYGDVEFISNGGLININNFTLSGNNTQHITQGGSNPIIINNLHLSKIGGGQAILDNDVTIKENLFIQGFGGYITTTPTKLLILDSNCKATDIQNLSGTFINGPVKKIGNQAFKFPIGEIRNNVARVAPLGISAPNSSTDAFTAQYFYQPPSLDGYDTSKYTPGFGGISGKEYWMLNRTEGNAQVEVTLSYHNSRSDNIFDLENAQIAGWNGTLWSSLLNGGFSGNTTAGTLQSGLPLTTYGPVTLSAKPIRKPIITIGEMDALQCIFQSFKVPYSLDTAMVTGNFFRVELSDSLGNFVQPVLTIGSKATSSVSDTILATLPSNVSFTKSHKIRIVGNLPPDTSINTATITPLRVPQQNFSIVGQNQICIGNGISKYYPNNIAPNTTYTWILTGGGNLTTVGDTAMIEWHTAGNFNLNLRSSNNCGNGPQSNLMVEVKPAAPSLPPIISKMGRMLSVNAPQPAQNVSVIQWYKNGLPMVGANSSQYYASTAGNYTATFGNDCGESQASNLIQFENASVPQTITFNPLPNKIFGDAPFSFEATASSGLPVSFSLISGPGNLTSGVFTITGTGLVTIKATQPGDDIYDTAVYVTRNFEITKATQSINFTIAPELSFPVAPFQLNGNTSSGLPIAYQLNSGIVTITSGNVVSISAPGLISISANQAGNDNYLPATSVTQTTCVRVTELTQISGTPFVCPGQTATYGINNVNGLTYSWRLSNGTTFASTSSSVNITWNTPGTYTLIVSGQANCGAPTANDSLEVQVLTAVTPGTPGNLLPANNTNGLALPLLLSWTAATNALNYDLYVWDSGTVKPATPFASNITAFGYTLPSAGLAYNKAYNWQVVSKNACLQTESVIQTFRLRPLPDLMVTQIEIPETANSGQTVSINWTVKNIGPGNTTTNQSWTDAVFLSFDTFPNFTRPPQLQAANWVQGEFPVRPLLLASKPNVTALDSGQQYSNSVEFTIPDNFSAQYYAYVITNFPAGTNAPLQMTVLNDTLRAPNALNVTPSPTPDLRVENVVTPTTTFSGSTITVSYRVKNYGVATTLPSKWTDKIYVSPSPLFNSNNAILLKKPKANGSYYPNALDAAFDTAKQLPTDAFIDLQAQVVVPNFIQGTWFVHVHTNATQSIYEGPLANNNINNTAFQILLTPTPGFIVNNLNIPFSSVSTTQPLSISYNVFNTGFNDNAERNKGHYYVPTTCPGGTGFRDSLGHGGSAWQDLVYISNNPNGLVPANARLLGTLYHVPNTGFSPEELLPLFCPSGSAPSNANTTNVIRPASSHPKSLNFTMPSDLSQGTYYLYVHANHNKQVFEFPDTPVVTRSAPIVVNRPDLTIAQINVPANAGGDEEITIAYTVKNIGSGGTFNATRRDLIYVSNSAILDGTATLLGQNLIVTNLAPNAESNHSFKHTFAAATNGLRYFHLVINNDSTFRETNYANNRNSAPVNVSTATPVDIIVSNMQLPDTIFAYKNNRIRYTITNNGTAVASGNWIDSIFISCSPTFNPSNAYFVQERHQMRILATGVSVSDSFNLVTQAGYLYNNCFNATDETNVYVFVKANANHGVYEGNLSNNNVTGSGLKRLNNTHVDHIVTSVSGPETATVGRNFLANWQVQNTGLQPTEGQSINRYNFWSDGIYFSPDSIFNNNAVFAGGKYIFSKLASGQLYTEQMHVVVPKLSTGSYFVHARTDYANSIPGEIEKSNNTNLIRNTDGTAKKIQIEQLPLPDLISLIENAPSTMATGQPIKINYRIKNEGVGPAFPTTWTDNVWLSTDLVPNNGNDVLLATKTRTGGLDVDHEYLDSISTNIPLNIATGNYIIIVQTDAGNAVIEITENNNASFSPIAIFTPASSDLIVSNVGHADTSWLGYPINALSWNVENISANAASGVSTDGIYLSKSGMIDESAVLQGVFNKNVNLPPLANELNNFAPMVTGVTEGHYALLVRTDLLNNIPETDKNNNIGQSGQPIFIGVKQLVLGVPEQNTLQNIERYYKLNIPDSLLGATILVTLKTPDSLSLKNEIFAGAGYIPGAARFDHRFDIPNSGNQTLLIESANAPVYYITVRSATPNPPVQNITITAVKLPFAILTIQSNSGGNGGNVTVKINGSLFSQGMSAKLTKAGTTINATKIFFMSGGLVYATFPLQGKPLGLYNISLEKIDGTVAELPNAFSVVTPNAGGLLTGGGINTGPNRPGSDPGCDPGADAGLNSQLVTELVYPAKVFNGLTFPVQVKYTNPTNMDIPAPTRVLFNDLNLKMSQSLATLESGTNPMVFQLIETNGPPGIIRAGGSGSFTIYSRAPIIRGVATVTFIIE